MHELGIVFHIADSLLAVGRENNLTSISSVTIELGEVSGVVALNQFPLSPAFP